MANTLMNSIAKEQSYKLTENGHIALSTTLDATLDLFGVIGALRTRIEEDIISLYVKAWAEEPTLALKMLFYSRDCRGGQGEKRTFKIIARYLADNHTEIMRRNIHLIPEFGRWDDLYLFDGTKLEAEAYELMRKQFHSDMHSECPSVLGKWLKSENASSGETRYLGKKTRTYFNMSPRAYRKALSTLRAKIDVVECKMSSNSWVDINYAGVPSLAHKNYRNAFRRHDEEGYEEYLESLVKGETKINSSQLFPYDIVRAYLYEKEVNQTLEAQWNALPKHFTDKNFLVMADVSGSMSGVPMETSIGLAIKFAEEMTGAFKGHYMTFEDRPKLHYIYPNMTLHDKIEQLFRDDWGGSTNLEAAFNLVLKAAIKRNVPQSEMPDAILVISDMEINVGANMRDVDDLESAIFTDKMKAKWEAAGYQLPTLVYWNVNARNNTFHADAGDNVRFVSGSSPSIFKDLCENMGSTAKDLMLNVLNSERYSVIE